MLCNIFCCCKPVCKCLPAAVTVVQSNCSDGDVRLVGGSNEYEGRVEICINQVWGTICSGSSYSRWGVTDGKIVCKQLGHQEFGKCMCAWLFYPKYVNCKQSFANCNALISNIVWFLEKSKPLTFNHYEYLDTKALRLTLLTISWKSTVAMCPLKHLFWFTPYTMKSKFPKHQMLLSAPL